ncbi:MAG: DUF4160 domain-containing protein [Bacteroidetes bacterium]|nr:DUF4160 domain-containing protein [Bacteroidota bacterium]
MPKIYEYLGIIIFFYSNEHEPIHIHAQKGEFESKAEIIVKNGKIAGLEIISKKGVKPLKGNDLKRLKVFLDNYAEKIVEKWIDYFVYHKQIKFERITKKLS